MKTMKTMRFGPDHQITHKKRQRVVQPPLTTLTTVLITKISSYLDVKSHISFLRTRHDERHNHAILNPSAWDKMCTFRLKMYTSISISSSWVSSLQYLECDLVPECMWVDDLRYNAARRLSFAAISTMQQLRHLRVTATGTSDIDLDNLRLLPLQHLSLKSSTAWNSFPFSITDTSFSHFAHMPLQFLSITDCRFISDMALTHIKSLPLHTLRLGLCHGITDKGLASLSGMPLHDLLLTDTWKVTNRGLKNFGPMPNLHRLTLSEGNKLTDGLMHLRTAPLCYLDLFNRRLTLGCCEDMKLMPLVHLNLGYCELTDNRMQFLRSTTHLQYLDLDGCAGITDVGLSCLVGLPLEHLDLSHSEEESLVTDASLSYIGTLTRLTYLSLNRNGFTNKGLRRLHGLSLLQSLALYAHSEKITWEGVSLLRVSLPECRKLHWGVYW
jgi:hypothetical protein